MTKQRRAELEARIIANRKHEPAPFTIIPSRGDWAPDAPPTRAHRRHVVLVSKAPALTGRMHVNTHAVQVMPIVPVNARTKAIARWWPAVACGNWTRDPMLRVHVWEAGERVACWTVTYP